MSDEQHILMFQSLAQIIDDVLTFLEVFEMQAGVKFTPEEKHNLIKYGCAKGVDE